MNILFVTFHYMDAIGGGTFASRAYINAFAKLFPNQVTLLYPGNIEHSIIGIDPSVNSISIDYNISPLKKLWNMAVGKVHRYYSIFPYILKRNKFDIIIFDHSRVSSGIIEMAKKTGAKIITIHHNYEVEYSRDNYGFISKYILMHWAKKFERNSILNSDLNLTLTPEDKELLSSHYDKNDTSKIDVIGTFESKPLQQRSLLGDNGIIGLRFIITGNLKAVQTENSLIPWLENYYPVLKEIFPNSTLTIAGKDPSEKILERCKKLGVRLVPSPKEMLPILQDADVYICPTDLGGGLKLRIMDGLREGMPVISHKVSTRGYHDFVDSGFLFSYTDKNSFRKACEALKNSNISSLQIKTLYRQVFSFESGVTRLKTILQDILDLEFNPVQS